MRLLRSRAIGSCGSTNIRPRRGRDAFATLSQTYNGAAQMKPKRRSRPRSDKMAGEGIAFEELRRAKYDFALGDDARICKRLNDLMRLLRAHHLPESDKTAETDKTDKTDKTGETDKTDKTDK